MFHMFIKLFLVFVLFFVVISTISADEHDQDLHAGDIQPWRVGAEIFVNGTVFEADFSDLSGGLFETDDPGINVNIAKGSFTPGNWLRFKAVGQLLFWDGAQWSKVIPNGERIEITDALNRPISFSGNSNDEVAGVIGEIGSDGGLHEHLNFKIFDATNLQNSTSGAYRILLRLFESRANDDTSVSVASTPIAIVFNRGLDHGNFEFAVAAANDLAENSVFIADSGVLTIQRVKALGTHYQVKFQHIGDGKFQLVEANEIVEIE